MWWWVYGRRQTQQWVGNIPWSHGTVNSGQNEQLQMTNEDLTKKELAVKKGKKLKKI